MPGEQVRSRWLEASEEGETLAELQLMDPVVALFAARCAGLIRREMGEGVVAGDGKGRARGGSVGPIGTLAAAAAAHGAQGAPPGARQLLELPIGQDAPAMLLSLVGAMVRDRIKSKVHEEQGAKAAAASSNAMQDIDIMVDIGTNVGHGLRPLLSIVAKRHSGSGMDGSNDRGKQSSSKSRLAMH